MALSSPSPEIKQLPTSPGLPVSGPLYRLSGRYQGQLEHRGRRAPVRGSTRRPTIQHGAEQLWRPQEGAHGDKQTGACSAAERCITPGQDVLDSLGLLLYCRELLGTVLDSVAETVKPGRRERRESSLCRQSLLSARLSHRRRSWTTSVDIAFPRDCAATSLARRARSVAERSSCFNLGLVLPSCI